jgi:hypothetical protein
MMDRGFDRDIDRGETALAHSSRRPVIDESLTIHGRSSSKDIVKKLLAFSVIGVLLFSAGVALGPKILKVVQEDDSGAHTLAGEREVTLRYTDFFNLGKKPEAIGGFSAYQELGRWNGTPGPSGWWPLRELNYAEWMVRDTYPYVLSYDPYSTETTPDIDAGPVITSWYRLYLEANNIAEIGTGIGKDPLFVPTLGNPDQDGGWFNISFYSTYLNTQEIIDCRGYVDAHYSEFYYDVNWAAVGMPRASNDDGYWHELQGNMDFSREACKKLLGLSATGDLETEFIAEQAAIETAWFDKYMADGSGGGDCDIYTAYDYPNDVRQVRITLDPDYIDEDPDKLYLRFWSLSWGNDVLLIRYLEKAGVWEYNEGWCDDWYLNMTVGPNQGDFDMRAVVGYHLTAWKDSLFFSGGWGLDTVHLDWCGNKPTHESYPSPYNPYDPDETDLVHKSWSPGTTNYGKDVSYYLAPLEWDLAEGEKIIIELPPEDLDVIAYEPYVGASDTLNEAKLTDYYDHSYWGTLAVGNGWPYEGPTNLKNYYDEETRTLTLEGPIDFPRNELTGYPGLLDCGSPSFFFDVSNVSTYELSIVEPDPYLPGVDYTLTVTAKNNSGNVIRCNNTIDLSSDDLGAVFGSATHTFDFSENGVWSTTVRLSEVGSWTIAVDDRYYAPDVDGCLGVTAIPEFGMILIPVVGVAAMMLLMRSARRRKKV